MVIFNLYSRCFCQPSDKAIIAFGGDHPVDRLAMPSSCRCTEETEARGGNWSY